MRRSLHRASKRLIRESSSGNARLPAVSTFLCPALLRPPPPPPRSSLLRFPHLRPYSTPSSVIKEDQFDVSHSYTEPPKLHDSCPGCGAPVQSKRPGEAGYYDLERAAVRRYLDPTKRRGRVEKVREEDAVFQSALKNADPKLLEQIGVDVDASYSLHDAASETDPALSLPEFPMCDRCHSLINHSSGNSIKHHPNVESIADTIAESPHRTNHIYHVIDAADFPMSLIKNLQHELDLAPMRTKNRRARNVTFRKGKIQEMSFIITRADLLCGTKDQVDSLMTYITEILRETLGRQGQKIRLGNVRLVSAQRGWWTKPLKDEIRQRNGANFLVGKVNVGKSKLFEVVFPRGTGQKVDLSKDLQEEDQEDEDVVPDSSLALLPPLQKETPYPIMPTVSALAGTTASPIRVPYNNCRGEVIDLPGLNRTSLDTHVLPEHRKSLIMTSRIIPEKTVIKPQQSLLLLGGLIRITPTTPDLVFEAYPFVPSSTHLTSTQKAIDIQAGALQTHVPLTYDQSSPPPISSAGPFKLEWDVTKTQTGSLTRYDAGKVMPRNLPFVVYSADILIESVGWVEVVAQVRKGRRNDPFANPDEHGHIGAPPPPPPEIEVFSPNGKFIGVRPPMSASLFCGKPKPKAVGRPRQSMKSVKARRG